MATLTITIEDETLALLRERAAGAGVAAEDVADAILASALGNYLWNNTAISSCAGCTVDLAFGPMGNHPAYFYTQGIHTVAFPYGTPPLAVGYSFAA